MINEVNGCSRKLRDDHLDRDATNGPEPINPVQEKARRANLERIFDLLPENCPA